ncbi:MAG: bifunctional adenosylcobinamide kinase/adenosylcobinamide-phosphate guanylyltransferase [Eubacteriales bacterium]
MIFITGGKAQGKSTFAGTLKTPIVDDLEEKIRIWLEQGIQEERDLLGKIEAHIIEVIDGTSVKSVWEEQVILVSREVGCGVVPIDKQESIWREKTGRIACKLAEYATEVYKMESGIAVRIK